VKGHISRHRIGLPSPARSNVFSECPSNDACLSIHLPAQGAGAFLSSRNLNMERSVDPAVRSVANSRSSARPHDPTILPTVACLIVGAVVAAYAAAVSVPGSDVLATMVALP
jgi:hypothetical protein